jgi:C-terminal processing protease CtpA/Prc
VRINPGGDNTTYGPLLAPLRSRAVDRRGRLILLTGRVTFSAAGNFVAEVEARTRAPIVGEAAGGSPHNYGDRSEAELETLGWIVHVPTQYVEVLGRRDERAAIQPDVRVGIGAADHFAGRDPVLAKAIAVR